MNLMVKDPRFNSEHLSFSELLKFYRFFVNLHSTSVKVFSIEF